MVKINCPNCNQEYEVDEALIGQKVECNSCHSKFIVQKDQLEDTIKSNRSEEKERDNDISHHDALLCFNCGKENKTGASYCAFCGQQIGCLRRCLTCNTEVTFDSRFCPNCGREIDIIYPSNSNIPRKRWNTLLFSQESKSLLTKVCFIVLAMSFVAIFAMMIRLNNSNIAKKYPSQLDNTNDFSLNRKDTSIRHGSSPSKKSTKTKRTSSSSISSNNAQTSDYTETLLLLMALDAAMEKMPTTYGGLPVKCSMCFGTGFRQTLMGTELCSWCHGTGYEGGLGRKDRSGYPWK